MIETVRFPVAGMTCASCINRITRSLRRLDGVERIKVDLGRETVTLRRDPDRVTDAALSTAIQQAGYQADLGAGVVVEDAVEPRRGMLRFFRH